jgi:hypothetical protein
LKYGNENAKIMGQRFSRNRSGGVVYQTQAYVVNDNRIVEAECRILSDGPVTEVYHTIESQNSELRGTAGTAGPGGTDIYSYTLVRYDPNVHTPEAYLVYSKLVSIAYETFVLGWDLKRASDISFDGLLSYFEKHWTVFNERKQFLDENIANLNTMNLMNLDN